MFISKTIYCLFIRRTSPKSSIQKIEIRHITGTRLVQKLSIKFDDIYFLQRGAEHGGLGACPLEELLKATASKTSDNALLKNRTKVAPITDLCTTEILTE